MEIDCPSNTFKSTDVPLFLSVDNFLPEEECDYLVEVANEREPLEAEIAETTEYVTGVRGVVNRDYRDLTWNWVPFHEHYSFYQRHWQRIKDINKKEFQFDISGIQDCMLMRYRDGDFFKEHHDAFVTSPSNEVRKITMVTLLNEPGDFEGGTDVFFGEEPTRLPLTKRGQTIMFQPTMLHRVEPVIGHRLVLVTWAVGDKWK